MSVISVSANGNDNFQSGTFPSEFQIGVGTVSTRSGQSSATYNQGASYTHLITGFFSSHSRTNLFSDLKRESEKNQKITVYYEQQRQIILEKLENIKLETKRIFAITESESGKFLRLPLAQQLSLSLDKERLKDQQQEKQTELLEIEMNIEKENLVKNELENKIKNEVIKQIILKKAEVLQLNQQSRHLLSLPIVRKNLDSGAEAYVFQQIIETEHLSSQSVNFINLEVDPTTICIIADFALDTAKNINLFLEGFAHGVYTGFLSTAQAMKAIYDRPELITHLSANVMNYLTSSAVIRDATYLTSGRMLLDLNQFLTEYFLYLKTLDSQQIGKASGEFTSQLLLGMASGELILEGRAVLQSLSLGMVEKGIAPKVGEILLESVRASESLVPILTSAEETASTIFESGETIARYSLLTQATNASEKIGMAEVNLIKSSVDLEGSLAKANFSEHNIYKAGFSVGGFKLRSLAVSLKHLPRLHEIRIQYSAELASLNNLKSDLIEAGESKREIARILSAERREIGKRLKEKTPQELQEFIYARNIELYNDPFVMRAVNWRT